MSLCVSLSPSVVFPCVTRVKNSKGEKGKEWGRRRKKRGNSLARWKEKSSSSCLLSDRFSPLHPPLRRSKSKTKGSYCVRPTKTDRGTRKQDDKISFILCRVSQSMPFLSFLDLSRQISIFDSLKISSVNFSCQRKRGRFFSFFSIAVTVSSMNGNQSLQRYRKEEIIVMEVCKNRTTALWDKRTSKDMEWKKYHHDEKDVKKRDDYEETKRYNQKTTLLRRKTRISVRQERWGKWMRENEGERRQSVIVVLIRNMNAISPLEKSDPRLCSLFNSSLSHFFLERDSQKQPDTQRSPRGWRWRTVAMSSCNSTGKERWGIKNLWDKRDVV